MIEPIPFTKAYNRFVIYYLLDKGLISILDPERYIESMNRFAIDNE